MQDFTYSLKTRFVFGQNALEQLGEEMKALGATRVLLHHDGGQYLYDTGLLGGIRQKLEAVGIVCTELGGVLPNPRLTHVRKGIAQAEAQGINALLAVGGGSVIDSAKAIAAGCCYKGDVWDLFQGKAPVQSTLPVAAVLTNPASGSESSTVMVVNNEETHEKVLVSSPVLQPALAVLCPHLTQSLPLGITACGVVDMFSHIAERYFNSDENFGIIDGMQEGAMASVAELGTALMDTPTDYRLRAELMWAGTVAHNNTLGVGRAQDWATHVIANELSALYDTPHGITLSVVMPAWMRYVYKHHPARFARYAGRVFGLTAGSEEELALAGIAATEAFFKKLGMPTSFKEAHLPTNEMDTLTAMVQMGNTLGDCVQLTRTDVKAIFALAAGPT